MIEKYSKIIPVIIILLIGCNNPSLNQSNTPVTFNVKIDKSIFAGNAELTARLYDSEQLKISESTANCTVSFDVTTKKESVSCPAGVTYKPTTPQSFTFKLSEINNEINIKSTTVIVGENYRLQISGKYKDNCNTASASVKETANSATVTLNNLEWAATELGCLP